MGAPSGPGIWSRNLSEEFHSESKRFRLIEKQRQLLEAKKSRQQQTTIVSTRPKSARNLRPGSGLSKSSDKISNQNGQDNLSGRINMGEIITMGSKNETNNNQSASDSNEKRRSSPSLQISPFQSPKNLGKRPNTVHYTGKRDQISRSKSSGDLEDDVEMIRDLDLSDKNRELNPLKSILNSSELLLFSTQQVSPGKTYQCVIIRDKRGIDRSFYPTYYIHLQAIVDISSKGAENESEASSPKSPDDRQRSADSNRKNSRSASLSVGGHSANRRQETNVLGFKGPRKMTVLIPKNEENCVYPNLTLLDLWKNDCLSKESKSIISLKNKTPVWNEDTQSYVLNFHGRVTQASVKNFQLAISDKKPDTSPIMDILNMKNSQPIPPSPIKPSPSAAFLPTNPAADSAPDSPSSAPLDDDIAMQFGRISDKEFTCDVTWPMSILQAFCIALSSFDSKLACE